MALIEPLEYIELPVGNQFIEIPPVHQVVRAGALAFRSGADCLHGGLLLRAQCGLGIRLTHRFQSNGGLDTHRRASSGQNPWDARFWAGLDAFAVSGLERRELRG